ncbi:hypothetical protein LGR64_12120 [Delftia sp. Lp-1]|uniref:hypothetical protein n=1 Tax=Delftia sp. Lp-1 TaxID=682863 RepID=UPI001E620584|nr:hypothetical protein [Delftia sp. Lp-1]MCB4787025.1 hypothetical protein [Delftia sp. Lp-1]
MKKMLIKRSLCISAIAFLASNSYAWNLIYSNDANGATTAGSLQALRTAAINGASIKVVVFDAGAQHWHAPCAQVSVKYDSTQSIVCLGNVDLLIDNTAGAQFGAVLSPPRSANFAANTLGQYAQADIQKSNGAILSRTTRSYPMSWYVD